MFYVPREVGQAFSALFLKLSFISDSELMYHKILKELCAKHGKIYTAELQAKNYGATDRAVCENVVKELGLDITVDELERVLEEMTRRILPRAPLQEGAERLLNHFHNTGVPIALATNSTRKAVRFHIAARPKLFGLFHHTVCATDPGVKRGKPYPDIYLEAAYKFPDKPKPIKCLVFEDSPTGLEAGTTAGMQVVMIPVAPLPPEYAQKPTIILKSLLDFKPEMFGLPPFKKNPASYVQLRRLKVERQFFKSLDKLV